MIDAAERLVTHASPRSSARTEIAAGSGEDSVFGRHVGLVQSDEPLAMSPSTMPSGPPTLWLPRCRFTRYSVPLNTVRGSAADAPNTTHTLSPGAPPTPTQPLAADDRNSTRAETL
jgi:hypothetical protein